MTDRPDLRAQRAYRARRTAKIEQMHAALRAIIAELGDKPGPVAVKCRQIATEALGEVK